MALTKEAMMIMVGIIFSIFILTFLLFGTDTLISMVTGQGIEPKFSLLPFLFIPSAFPKLMHKSVHEKKGIAGIPTWMLVTVIMLLIVVVGMFTIYGNYDQEFPKVASGFFGEITQIFT